MQIYGPVHVHGTQPLSAPHTARAAKPTPSADSGQIRDELQISEAGRLAEQAGQTSEIRQDRVDSIRRQIAEGTYDTDEKLETAMHRMLDEIG